MPAECMPSSMRPCTCSASEGFMPAFVHPDYAQCFSKIMFMPLSLQAGSIGIA